MLIAELARRGISEQQFLDLLAGNVVRDLRSRLSDVWIGLSDAFAGSLMARYGSAALHRYAEIGARAEDTAEAYFLGHCSPDLDKLAKATLKEHLYWTGPINYIGGCSNSMDDLRFLEGLPVPERASLALKNAATAIKDRVERR